MTSTITNEIPKVLQPVITWPLIETAYEKALDLLEIIQFLKDMEVELSLFDGHNHYRFQERYASTPVGKHFVVRVTFGKHFVVVSCENHLSLYRPLDCSHPPFGYEALGV